MYLEDEKSFVKSLLSIEYDKWYNKTIINFRKAKYFTIIFEHRHPAKDSKIWEPYKVLYIALFIV